MSVVASDIFWSIVFGQGVIVLALSVLIIIRYALLLKARPSLDRAMPWHIVLISVSYAGATVFICLELWWRLGNPMTYRTPFGLGIFLTGDLALLCMMFHLIIQRRYLDKIRARTENELTPRTK